MEFDELAGLIQQRRTSMPVEKDRPIPHDVVEQLCALAQWAPNHKRTWPWRFALVEGDARARIGNVIADVSAAAGTDIEKVTKSRTKYLRTPAVLVVGSVPGDKEYTTFENRDATAAGVQNILLGATTLGLASYWASCPLPANDAVAAFCGFASGTHITAMIYLGWAASAVAAPERPPLDVRYVS